MPRYIEEFTDVNMSCRDYENWRDETRIATEERQELVDECKDLEEKLSSLVSLNQFLVRQISELQAELELERSRYTLGGIPPKPNAPHWVNVEAPRVSSADDPSAPPLRRSDTSSSFGGESGG